MKKLYITPSVEIEDTEMNQMITLSVINGGGKNADPLKDVLSTEDQDWNIWSDADTDEE